MLIHESIDNLKVLRACVFYCAPSLKQSTFFKRSVLIDLRKINPVHTSKYMVNFIYKDIVIKHEIDIHC